MYCLNSRLTQWVKATSKQGVIICRVVILILRVATIVFHVQIQLETNQTYYIPFHVGAVWGFLLSRFRKYYTLNGCCRFQFGSCFQRGGALGCYNYIYRLPACGKIHNNMLIGSITLSIVQLVTTFKVQWIMSQRAHNMQYFAGVCTVLCKCSAQTAVAALSSGNVCRNRCFIHFERLLLPNRPWKTVAYMWFFAGCTLRLTRQLFYFGECWNFALCKLMISRIF